MGVWLLGQPGGIGVGASTTGNWVDCHSVGNIRLALRITAEGSFAGSPVIIESSPDGGTTAFQQGTIATGNALFIEAPVDYIRARTDGSLTGKAWVVAEISG